MAKFCLKKKSKRQPARQRYKILKKIKEHHRKVKREAKKHPKSKKPKIVQVPNICPFKEDIIKEVELLKKQKEEERKQAKEAARKEKMAQKSQSPEVTPNLDLLVQNAQVRGKIYDTLSAPNNQKDGSKSKEISLKTFYKEFKKVLEAADIILEILDARDPLGTRCKQVEEAIHEAGGTKRLVVILNKADLVPPGVLDNWLKYFKKSVPALPFKSSTQVQTKKLGRKKMSLSKSNRAMQNSTCVGAELVMSVLANYCRNKGIKTSITVGVVGLPNVGKSSLINSLKRSRACSVGATPGVTKAMQEVQLDSKIKLLDSPGIVFASGAKNDSSIALKNALSAGSLSDPIKAATAIFQRCTKMQLIQLYNVNDFTTAQQFFSVKAAGMGRFKKGGVPDSACAARSLIEDWNSGKIKYFTVPPEEKSSSEVHISSAIVSEAAKEFDIDNFEAMQTEVISQMNDGSFGGEVRVEQAMEADDDETQSLLSSNIKITSKKTKTKAERKDKKKDPAMELEGNLKLNKVKKVAFKKVIKDRNRREKVSLALANGFKNLMAGKDEDYNFEEVFGPKEN